MERIAMPGIAFKHVIWDVDGTLFDTYPAISAAILAALAEQGVKADREFVTHMAMTSLGTTLPTLAKRYKLDLERLYVRYEFFLVGTPLGSQRPFPGVKLLLRQVIKNGGLNLISTHRPPDSLIPMLKYHRMNSLFADKLTVYDGYPRKPDPAMFNELIKRHKLNRAEILAIGDRDLDLAAGKAAGIQTALYGNAPIQVTPDLHILDYRDVFQMIKH
jgi:phosphoglycolate phosphatase-like HAD superfamily hydrolase